MDQKKYLNRVFIITGLFFILPGFIWIGLKLLDISTVNKYDLGLIGILNQAIFIFNKQSNSFLDLGPAMLISISRVLFCILASSILGVVLGTTLYYLNRNKLVFQPTIDFLRALPVTFLIIPLSLAIRITGKNIPWIIASLPCSLAILVCVSDRAAIIDEERRRIIGSFFGFNDRLSLFVHLDIFELFSGFVTGLRIAVPYSVILIGVLESVGCGSELHGFGYLIFNMTQAADAERGMMVGVIIYGILGLGLVFLTNILCDLVMSWDTDLR